MSIMLAVFATALLQQPSCEALKSVSIPNVTITSATFMPEGSQLPAGRGNQGAQGAPLPAHCKVAATLKPTSDSEIGMELWLPAENWNGKFLAVGNGAWAGNIETAAIAAGLRRGYATASNDTGHKGGGAAFVVGHPEKLIDFAYRAMHEMAVHSKTLIQTFYKQAPRLSYYQGCSTGGRQGMMSAQKYPEDFDAIIAGAPVYNMMHLNVSQVALQVAMLRAPSTLVPAAKVSLFATQVMAACDASDSVKDGIVSDPRSCKFDPSTLICKDGDAADCLTRAQADNAKSAYMPVLNSKGELVYPGRSPGFESGWRIPTPGQAINPLFGDTPRYVGRQDANWDVMTFDLETDLALSLKNGGFVEANDPDLSKFKARGGKLLFYHGWADPGPAPENTINYYEAVNKKLGAKQDDWMRLFLMPGMGHCSGGVGPDQADFLGAIEQWREAGKAPDQIVATRRATRGLTELSRPLCPFPQVPRFSGVGSTTEAKNFSCVQP